MWLSKSPEESNRGDIGIVGREEGEDGPETSLVIWWK